MIRINENFDDNDKNQKNFLALNSRDLLEFRRYTVKVWSKTAKKTISDREAGQIIEDFGRFLEALANQK